MAYDLRAYRPPSWGRPGSGSMRLQWLVIVTLKSGNDFSSSFNGGKERRKKIDRVFVRLERGCALFLV